jgi:NIMA (never in mitosis gene a)-related kinase
VLLDRDAENIKLGDFGLARILSKHSLYARTNVGTPFYMSPEQISGMAYNEKSDVWSLGCVIYELAALMPPFEASNQVALALKIKEGRFPPLSSRYSSELQRVVASMLQTEVRYYLYLL